MKLSKLAVIYAIFGVPIGFKNYIGVFIHMLLYLIVSGLTGLEIFRILHYKLYVYSDIFAAIFNPFLFAYIRFNCIPCFYFAVTYPIAILVATKFLKRWSQR